MEGCQECFALGGGPFLDLATFYNGNVAQSNVHKQAFVSVAKSFPKLGTR